MNALKITSKGAIQKTAEVTSDLMENNVANKIAVKPKD